MDVRNCRKCGKLYNYAGAPAICPACKEELDKKFVEVKEYIYEHKNCSVSEVAEACEITTQQIKQWLREEKLEFAGEAGDVLSCENCGEAIRSGRFCEKCKHEMAKDFNNSIMKKPEQQASKPKDSKDNPRMRFLDY